MKLSKVHKYMLFTLGFWYEEASHQIKHPLNISIKKVDFVNIILRGKFAEKGERAVYKNLEFLEKKRLVSYENRELRLSDRGKKHYDKIKEDITPYFQTAEILKYGDPLRYSKRIQTKF